MTARKKRKSLIISQKKSIKKQRGVFPRNSSGSGGKVSRWVVRLIFVCFLGTIFYVLFFSPLLILGKIEVEETNFLNSEELEKKLNQEFQGEYLNFISKKNFFLLNESLIEEKLKNDYKIIREVKLEKKVPKEAKVFVTEKTPSLVVCADTCWIIDELGVVFSHQEGVKFETGKLPIFFGLQDSMIRENEEILKPDYLQFILNFRKEVQEKIGLELKKEISTPNIYSGDLRMNTQEGWAILVNENIGVEKETAMLDLVLEKEEALKDRNELEYIDLRTENRVYYRFKNAQEDEAAQEENGEEESEEETEDSSEESSDDEE